MAGEMSYFGLALESLEAKLAANYVTNPWNDPRRMEMLRELLPKHSAAQVAKAINVETGSTLTRNAVIGKAGRIGLKGHIAHPNKGTRKPRKPNALRPYRILQKLASGAARMSGMAIGVEVDRPFDDELTPLVMNPMGYNEDWPNNRCRWPVGEVKSPDFYFCGSDDGVNVECREPWCKFHKRLAYTPSRAPLRAAMAGPRG